MRCVYDVSIVILRKFRSRVENHRKQLQHIHETTNQEYTFDQGAFPDRNKLDQSCEWEYAMEAKDHNASSTLKSSTSNGSPLRIAWCLNGCSIVYNHTLVALLATCIYILYGYFRQKHGTQTVP